MNVDYTLHTKFKTKNTVFSTDCSNTTICHVFNAGMLLGKDKVATVLTLACKWVSCQFHASATLPPWRKSFQYPMKRRLCGPHSWSGEKKKMYLAPDGKEPRFVSPANNLATILTQLWNTNGHS